MKFVFIFRFAAAVQDGSQYFVLLIITDGIITDMQQTQQAIVNVIICICINLGRIELLNFVLFCIICNLEGFIIKLHANTLYVSAEVKGF